MSTGNSMHIICQNFQGQYKLFILEHVVWTFYEREMNGNVKYQSFTKYFKVLIHFNTLQCRKNIFLISCLLPSAKSAHKCMSTERDLCEF